MGTISDMIADPRLLEYLHNLEQRIERIENQLELQPDVPSSEPPVLAPKATGEERDEALELRIGQYWFAKAGVLILGIGIAFLLTFPYRNLPPILPSLFGYVLVLGILSIGYRWRDAMGELAHHLLAVGLVLLYFTTLRLHYFSNEIAIASKPMELVFLSVVVIASLFLSAHRKSMYMVGLSAALGYVTALIGGEPLFVFVVVSVMSAIVVYFAGRRGWFSFLLFGIILTYLTHALWALNNPILGNGVELVRGPEYSLFFLLLYAIIFAGGTLLRAKGLEENETVGAISLLNLAGSYTIFLLMSVARFKDDVAIIHLLASVVFLSFAVGFWLRERSKYSTFLYAMAGYAAMSTAIVGQFGQPEYFIWLAWQSVLVVSTAIWFRSRFIIVANFVIFVLVFFAYLVIAGTVSAVSLNFGVIALISARILNWQKDRLELKTDMMRNAYLASAFVFFPYALYHSVPGGYVSISWLGLALFYYLMSLYLRKNRKYRWMALLTMVLTVGYVILVDLTKLEPEYRIISFIVLGIVLLGVSVVYTRKKLSNANEGEQKETSKSELMNSQ